MIPGSVQILLEGSPRVGTCDKKAGGQGGFLSSPTSSSPTPSLDWSRSALSQWPHPPALQKSFKESLKLRFSSKNKSISENSHSLRPSLPTPPERTWQCLHFRHCCPKCLHLPIKSPNNLDIGWYFGVYSQHNSFWCK